MTPTAKMHAWDCPCGTRNAPSLSHCHKCGQALAQGKPVTSPPQARCAHCGGLEEAGTPFCRVCGKSMTAPPPAPASPVYSVVTETGGDRCRRCHQGLKPGWEYCEACGKLQDPLQGVRVVVALFTLLLLWGFGVWASGSPNPLLQLRYALRFLLGS